MRSEREGSEWQPIGTAAGAYGGSMPRAQGKIFLIETNDSGDLRKRLVDLEDINNVGDENE